MHRHKKQNTPQRRARKNEDDGSLPFLHRPPESGLILNRSCVICVIYDGGRLPESATIFCALRKIWVNINTPPRIGTLGLGRPKAGQELFRQFYSQVIARIINMGLEIKHIG